MLDDRAAPLELAVQLDDVVEDVEVVVEEEIVLDVVGRARRHRLELGVEAGRGIVGNEAQDLRAQVEVAQDQACWRRG